MEYAPSGRQAGPISSPTCLCVDAHASGLIWVIERQEYLTSILEVLGWFSKAAVGRIPHATVTCEGALSFLAAV